MSEVRAIDYIDEVVNKEYPVIPYGYLEDIPFENCVFRWNLPYTKFYTGDVVEIDSSEIDGPIVTGVIEFNTDNTLGNIGFGLWCKGGWMDHSFLGEITLKGNIYENPELIELYGLQGCL